METQADNTAPVDTGEVDSNPVETTSVDPASTGTEAAAPADDRSEWTKKAQERYDALTREKYEALSARDRESYRREALEREIAQIKAEREAKTEPVAPVTNFPTLEQFNWDEAKFNAAVATYWRDTATTTARAEARAAIESERQQAAAEAKAQTWAAKEAEFIKSKPDYVEKVKNAQFLPISEELQAELQDSDLGPQVAMYLVENREKAQSIMGLPLKAQLREVGRIEAALEAARAAPKAAVSSAPAPVGKVEGEQLSGSSVKTTDASGDALSTEEWVRRERLRTSRKR